MKSIDKILKAYEYNPARIIQILSDAQSIKNYLPKEILVLDAVSGANDAET